MTPISDLHPAAARLACAVAEMDIDASHELLLSLSRHELMSVAVLLAASVDLEKPLGSAGTNATAANLNKIIRVVADRLGVKPSEITSRDGRKHITEARQIVCWVAIAQGITSVATGRAIGRDHSTALHGVDKVTQTARLLHIARGVHDDLGAEAGAA